VERDALKRFKNILQTETMKCLALVSRDLSVAMALIPVKHRKSFVNGIMDAYDEGKLWFI